MSGRTRLSVPTGIASVTPADSGTNCPADTRGLACTGAGNASLVYADGTTGIVSLVLGVVFPAAVTRVNSTGTTATGITAHF